MEDQQQAGNQQDAEKPLSAEQQAELTEFAAAWDELEGVYDVDREIAERSAAPRTNYTEQVAYMNDMAELEAKKKRLMELFASGGAMTMKAAESVAPGAAAGRTDKPPTVQQAIAPFIDRVMNENPNWTASELYNLCCTTSGNDGSPFIKRVTGRDLFCRAAASSCSLKSIEKALTAWRQGKGRPPMASS